MSKTCMSKTYLLWDAAAASNAFSLVDSTKRTRFYLTATCHAHGLGYTS